MGTPHPVAGVEDADKWELVIKGWLSLGLTAGVSLELFSLIGSWFIAAVEPLSQGITNVATKRLQGRKFNIGLDWPFIAGRAEIWACANVLAPIMLVKLCFFQTSEMVSCHLQVSSLWVLLQLSWLLHVVNCSV